ncbi:uncharacterized protein Dwil_GK16240 [Drosophila willistoni]|uniref:Glycosyltransferase family 92 protein n=1 Tax=Drosophila willistoni TaxID=7260 RepID=B4N1S1_DROWI|nr:uncharacterized protein LOC6644832 [Drosophila willistoni]EDW78310.1 uncharacterized protein Dwil_GK16240 [Drosophila willistoni]
MTLRSGFAKATILVFLALFALLLVINIGHHDTRQQLQDELLSYRAKAAVPSSPTINKVTPPAVQYVEEPVNEQLVLQLEQELPEVDYKYWYYQAKPKTYRLNKTCAPYPDPLELQLYNIYWQSFLNANVTFRLYAAYLDTRDDDAEGPRVRVLGTANQIGEGFPQTYCHLWYDNHSQPMIVNVTEFVSVWVKGWGNKPQLSYPHLLSCPLPKEMPPNLIDAIPRTVSLVTDQCKKATNSLRVHYERKTDNDNDNTNNDTNTTMTSPKTLNFGVCVKGFDFPYVDLSERLIEWFEMQRLMGATRIYAYMYDVHPSVQRVLDYYQHEGFLELRPLTMANGMPRLKHYQHMLLQQRLLVKRLNELIPYNDCFYRNMYRHDYLLNVDIDEVMLPLGDLTNWQQVIETTMEIELSQPSTKCPKGFVAFCFINSYFSKVVGDATNHEEAEQSEELYVLQHVMRHRNFSRPGQATKCFHNTNLSITLHNHFTLKWITGGCRPRTVSTEHAKMQHYREPDKNYELSELVEDRSIWRFASELRKNVEHVWIHLNDGAQQTIGNLEEEQSLDELLEEDLAEEQTQQILG